MSEFTAFLERQNGIYEGMRSGHEAFMAEDSEQGVHPDVEGLGLGVGGEPNGFKSAHLIAYRFPRNVAESLSQFSERLAADGEAVAYGVDGLHVTISGYDLNSERVIDPEVNLEDAGITNVLTRGVESAYNMFRKNDGLAAVTYNDVVVTEVAVLALGQPSEEAFKMRSGILAAVKAESECREDTDDIVLSGTWGFHVTLGRFLTARDSRELRGLRRTVAETVPLIGEVVMSSVDVCSLTASADGFVLRIHESFPLGDGRTVFPVS